MLPGLASIAGIARNPPVTVTYGSAATDAPPFSQSMSIGAAASNRRVVVCVAVRDTTASFGSCTVAGQSCTQIASVSVDGGSFQQNLAMFVTDDFVTSGTTATVVWNTTDSTGAAAVAQTYAIYGARAGVVDAQFNVAADPSVNVIIPAYGAAIGFSGVRTASDTCSWTGATEGGQATATMLETSAAAYTTDIAIAAHTLQATWTTGSVDSIIAASFSSE